MSTDETGDTGGLIARQMQQEQLDATPTTFEIVEEGDDVAVPAPVTQGMVAVSAPTGNTSDTPARRVTIRGAAAIAEAIDENT